MKIHFRFILEDIFNRLDKRRLNFILIVLVAGVTVFLLDMVFMINGESYQHILTVKNTLQQKENYLNVQVIPDERIPNYPINVSKFDAELQKEFGSKYGKFMEMDIAFQKVGENCLNHVLYIDKTILDLCHLSLAQGKKIEKDEGQLDYIEAYVGNDLKEDYPIGTILVNSYTHSNMKVVGVLKKGVNWVPTSLFGTTETKINLDDKIVSEMDHSIFETSVGFYGNIYNSMYLKCDNKKEVETSVKIIRKIAKEQEILCYSHTINQLIKKEKESNRQIFQSIGILTIFVVILACIALLASSAADIYSRRYDIGIMYIHGISRMNIFLMTWIENLLKLLIAFGVAIFLYSRKLEGDRLFIHSHIVIWQLLAFLIIMSIFISFIACILVNQKDVTKLIKSVE